MHACARASTLDTSQCAHSGCASFGGGLRRTLVNLSGARGSAQVLHYWYKSVVPVVSPVQRVSTRTWGVMKLHV